MKDHAQPHVETTNGPVTNNEGKRTADDVSSGVPGTQPAIKADKNKDATENDGTHGWEPVGNTSLCQHPRDSDWHLDHATSLSLIHI